MEQLFQNITTNPRRETVADSGPGERVMNTIARKLPSVARVFLGFVFTVFGLNGFLHFIPQPPMSGPPADFFMALFGTGYMVPLIMGTELVAGVLLLAGRFVPLALTLLAPVIVNI